MNEIVLIALKRPYSDKLVNGPLAGLLEGQHVQALWPGPDWELASARPESR